MPVFRSKIPRAAGNSNGVSRSPQQGVEDGELIEETLLATGVVPGRNAQLPNGGLRPGHYQAPAGSSGQELGEIVESDGEDGEIVEDDGEIVENGDGAGAAGSRMR